MCSRVRFCWSVCACATLYSKIMTISHGTLSCIHQRNDFDRTNKKKKQNTQTNKQQPTTTTDSFNNERSVKNACHAADAVWMHSTVCRFVRTDVWIVVDFILFYFFFFWFLHFLLNFQHFNQRESIVVDIFCIVAIHRSECLWLCRCNLYIYIWLWWFLEWFYAHNVCARCCSKNAPITSHFDRKKKIVCCVKSIVRVQQ